MKTFGLLLMLLLPTAMLAQMGSAFAELPTMLLPDTVDEVDLAELPMTVITQFEYLRLEGKSGASVVAAPAMKPDSPGVFVVRTANPSFEFQETNEYEGSYQYLGLVPEVRSHMIVFCGEGMCETYLLDHETDDKLTLPADYDAGVMDLLLSPAKDRMLVCSSYDGPDYTNYYAHRAMVVLYRITKGQGLAGLLPLRVIVMDDRSIERVVWKDDRTLALKTYAGARWGEGVEEGYAYFSVVVE